jgi:hypothetical protein
MKILIFTEGTLIMHKSALNVSREVAVDQVKNDIPDVHDFRNYIPSFKAVEKLKKWKDQGAELYYLTSRKEEKEIGDVEYVLNKFDFPDKENLEFCLEDEVYKDVAEKVLPDILIEDDCESIGGNVEMTYPHISTEIQPGIKSIVVKEFGGIGNLPDDLDELTKMK